MDMLYTKNIAGESEPSETLSFLQKIRIFSEDPESLMVAIDLLEESLQVPQSNIDTLCLHLALGVCSFRAFKFFDQEEYQNVNELLRYLEVSRHNLQKAKMLCTKLKITFPKSTRDILWSTIDSYGRARKHFDYTIYTSDNLIRHD